MKKLKHIATCYLKYYWEEKIAMRLAFAMPRQIAYWCAIRVGAHATCGKWGYESPTHVPFMDTIQRWHAPN